MTEKQFNDAFTAAGGWFILTQYEVIADWTGSRADLVDYIYTLGFDAKRTGSNTRVSSVLRLIDENQIREAIIKIRDSKTINRQHPEAYRLAMNILINRFNFRG